MPTGSKNQEHIYVSTANTNIVFTFRFDPTQLREWERFRNCSIGDSSMLAARDRIEDWRNRSDSFGQRFGKFNAKIV